MSEPTRCACCDDVLLCDACRQAAIELAAAVAEICETTRASAVNEIEYTDPFTGRVSTLRRGDGGQWSVTDVRQMGGIERARCRPAASSA
jgi:hypothetical protein